MSADKLVYMANQIATFFETQPGADGAGKVAAHILDFWEPRMRAELIGLVDAGEAGLKPLALDAVALVRAKA